MNNFNKLNRKSYFKDILIVVLIVMIPFFFFIYNFAPDDSFIWETYMFKIDFTGFEDVNYTLWLLTYKVLTISLLSIWFFTCRHSWSYILLLPLSVEFIKLINLALYIKTGQVLLFYYWYLGILPIIFSLIYLKKRYGYSSIRKSFYIDLNNEINNLMHNALNFNKKGFIDFKNEFIYLRKNKLKNTKREYLIKLIKLRDSINLD